MTALARIRYRTLKLRPLCWIFRRLRGAARLACMDVAVSAAQPQTLGEHILQPEWPADKVERRAVAALIRGAGPPA
jgi:hypothetical protein